MLSTILRNALSLKVQIDCISLGMGYLLFSRAFLSYMYLNMSRARLRLCLPSSNSKGSGWILQDKVVNEMEELYQFTRTANQVLDLRVGDEREAGEVEETAEDEVLQGEELAAKRKEQEEQVTVRNLE
jgi:hypothetical protein